ncbi:putative immunoglobulin-blocking virulence protein [Mycoplasma zalophidermidis]|uniref:Immunoglobulin-blocking virulence protein n=1 Tax=Mycoplasma zalophidermidis TaxID=398174 RepID=A0ABS6DQQ0_9MOLU|nr:putative immunoglobulin-blocking virulence protein [Mycoplasma zalophidermidis]MBU4689448.1 putative immunoglobulin-blocking virulence protein [Mycoplasma zalophidermidis]MBU4693325.1 putative immunoglobulin-blocking virulence protein [Mycoplasma zalophidermidis]
MSLFKKRKTKVIVLSLLGSVIASGSIGTIVYFASVNSQLATHYTSAQIAKPNFIPKDNLELKNTNPSNADNNLKEIPKPEPLPEPEKPKPEPVPKKEIQKIPEPEKPKPEKPKPKPEKPKPKPEPKPKPAPEKPKPKPVPLPPQKTPESPSRDNNKQTIIISGIEVKADITPFKPRQIFDFDVRNKISNVNPYINDSTGKLNSVEVTKELREKVLSDTKGGLSSGFGQKVWELSNEIDDPNQIKSFWQQQPWVWEKISDKWQRLFDSPNVKKFLKEGKDIEYQKMLDNNEFKSKEHRYSWLYKNFDFTKVTKLTSNAEAQLAKGFTTDPDNVYINENGEIDSYAYSPAPDFNSVTSRLKRDNYTRRVFSYNTEWMRNPDDVKNGIYPGWSSSNINTDPRFDGLINQGDGINAILMKRDKPDNSPNQINEGIVIEIDASNKSGYDKTITLIKKIKEKNLPVVSYRIRNMGQNDSAQAFKPILEELPNDIKQLELFFSAQATNTGSLIALENKHIKELSLYTLGNSLQDEWTVNPLSVRNTEWINTNDYNVSSEYNINSQIATRITFDTLAFDQIDYNESSSDPYERINLGLRMAYYARNNEPFFQGGLGPGLNPDNNEKGNSYPTGLDFSRVPKIRTLHGLIFNDTQKPTNGSRKVTRVTFFNNKEYYEIGLKDLDSAGLENFATGPFQTPKIFFSNKRGTTKFKYTDSSITSNAISNLQTFTRYAKNGDEAFTGTVLLDPGNTSVKSALEGAGIKVEIDNGYDYL